MNKLEDLLLKIKNRRLVVMIVPTAICLTAGFLLVVKPSLSRIKLIQKEANSLSQKENSPTPTFQS